jgi:predicted transcriptional regulator of viral defense system
MAKWRGKEAFRQVARRQHGRVSWAQLKLLGLADSTIAGWIESGYLTRVLPRVYAIGHDTANREAVLWEAVLYAGPGAMLSHATAAHHHGLIDRPPAAIGVSTPRDKIRSLQGRIEVHGKRTIVRVHHLGLPTTTVAQTLLDLAAAAQSDTRLVRRALANLDFQKRLDIEQLERVCGKGRPGSRTLRAALAAHQPQLAYANGELEERFLTLCEHWQVPLPKLNCSVHGYVVDAYWPGHGLVVELDGHANHSSPAQLRRDRERDLALRSHGLIVVRYDWHLVTRRPHDTRADLLRQLELASAAAAGPGQPGQAIP